MNEPLSLISGLYHTISNDFAEKLVLKMKEKLCEERSFGVLKTLKTQELPGALPPGPPPGRCPWTPPERAPGPHAVRTLHSLCSLCSTSVLGHKLFLFSTPRSNKSCTCPCFPDAIFYLFVGELLENNWGKTGGVFVS